MTKLFALPLLLLSSVAFAGSDTGGAGIVELEDFSVYSMRDQFEVTNPWAVHREARFVDYKADVVTFEVRDEEKSKLFKVEELILDQVAPTLLDAIQDSHETDSNDYEWIQF